MVAFNLLKKELKQNSFIFIIPYLILLGVTIIKFRDSSWLNPNWAEILTICLPFAMAGAYGLQAFDLEVCGQTKDFLLTKPLTIKNIIWSKFFCGIAVLLPFTLWWVALLYQQSLVKPDLNNVNSFWLTAFIMMTLILYSASFLTGILVKGPIKLLVAIFIGGLALGWTLFAWSEFLTFIFYLHIERFPLLALIAYFVFIILLLLLIVRIFIGIVSGIFKNIALKDNLKQVILYVLILIILPLLVVPINYFNKPIVRSFDYLLTSIFNADDWFFVLKGANQPSGDLFAFNDGKGRLAIGKPYKKPEVVYESSNDEPEPLINLAWSPDGKNVAFSDKHRIKLYSLSNNKTIDFYDGDISFWSHDNKEILVGKILESETQRTELGEVQKQVISLAIFNHKTGSGRILGNMTTTGLSLGWDSKNGNMLAVDISGFLKVISFSGTVKDLDLFANDEREIVFISEIQYAESSGERIKVVVYSVAPQKNVKTLKYNVRWYDYFPDSKKIKLTSVLYNNTYQDMIGYFKDNSVLVRKYDNGLYKKVDLLKQVD